MDHTVPAIEMISICGDIPFPPTEIVTTYGSITTAILFLAALDKSMSNLAAHHLQGKIIARLVSMRGGLKALPSNSVLKNFLYTMTPLG